MQHLKFKNLMFLGNGLNMLKINMDYQKLLAELKLSEKMNSLGWNYVWNWNKDTCIWMINEMLKKNEHNHFKLLKSVSFGCGFGLEAMLTIYKGLVYFKNLNLEFPLSLRTIQKFGIDNLGFEAYFRPYECILEKYWKLYSTIFTVLCGKSIINEKLPRELFRLLKTFLPEYTTLPEKTFKDEMYRRSLNLIYWVH
jgi:hypothetical protein